MAARLSAALDALAGFGDHASETLFSVGYWHAFELAQPEAALPGHLREVESAEHSAYEVDGQLDEHP